MKLPFDENDLDEFPIKGPPSALTESYLPTLASQQIKKSGVFQILQFKKKRDLVYSTKISDGFFKIKVMVIGDSAEQIQSGQIKLFSVLNGPIKNHGQGVFIIKEKVKYWNFNRLVGYPEQWKFKKENFNPLGNGFIDWHCKSQKLEHVQKTQSLQTFKSKSQNDFEKYLISQPEQTSIKKQPFLKRQVQSTRKLMLSSQKTQSMGQIVQTPQKIFSSKKTNQQEIKMDQSEQIQEDDVDSVMFAIAEGYYKNQKAHLKEQKEIEQTPQKLESIKKNNKQRLIQMILDEQASQNEQQEETSPEISVGQVLNKSIQKSNKKTKIEFILELLENSDEEETKKNSQDGKGNNEKQQNDSDDNQQFVTWFENKQKRQKSQSLQQPQFLQISPPKINLQSAKLQTDPQIKKPSQQFPPESQLHISDITHGFFSSKSKWWFTCLLKIYQRQQKNNVIRAIVSDLKSQQLVDVVFYESHLVEKHLAEGAVFRMKGGNIKEVFGVQAKLEGSAYEIEFNCKKLQLEFVYQLQNPKQINSQPPFESTKNYCPISKIITLKPPLIINFTGIVMSHKIIKTKANKYLSNYQIVDIQTNHSTFFTDFDVDESDYKLTVCNDYVGKMITVFNARINLYKGKVRGSSKIGTIVRVGWAPNIPLKSMMVEWLQSGKDVCQIEVELDYHPLNSVSDLYSEPPESEIFLPFVQLLEFKSNPTYIACTKCLKKVQAMRCRSCGIRSPDQIKEKFFIRGLIGDRTATIDFILDQKIGANMMKDGFEKMKERWLLKRVQVWVVRTPESCQIVKLKRISSNNQKLLQKISNQQL